MIDQGDGMGCVWSREKTWSKGGVCFSILFFFSTQATRLARARVLAVRRSCASCGVISAGPQVIR